MKIDELFKVRDSSYIRLNNVTDYLGRSLRENVVIFEIDDRNSKVSFLSESQKLISCNYKITEDKVYLSEVKVNDSDDIMSDEAVDTYLSEKVSSFVTGIRESKYDNAIMDFDNMLDVFKTRHEISEKRNHLSEKLKSISESSFVRGNDSFEKLVELKENITSFVTENADELKGNGEILNSIRLNNSMSRVFDVPKLTYDELVKEGYVMENNADLELYEMVCRRELIAREITESKRNFTGMWVKNDKLRNLTACMINEELSVQDSLTELVKDVPYFALASKAEINEAISKVAALDLGENIPKKRVREFTALVFEMKKPAKGNIVKRLNESYGVNINNLRYVPTFSDLAKTQSILFESLEKVSSSKTLKDIFSSISKIMDGKSGIDTLVVSDIINEAFGDSLSILFEENIPLLEDSVSLRNIGEESASLIEEQRYHGDMEDMANDEDEEEEEEDSKKKAKKKIDKKKKKDDEDEDEEVTDENSENEKKKKKVVSEGLDEDGNPEEVDLTDEEIADGGVPSEEVVDDGEEEEEEDNDNVDLTDEELHKLTDDIEDVLGKMKTSSKKGDVNDEPDLSDDDDDE